MHIFPTQYSTLSTHALKEVVRERYGFKNLEDNFDDFAITFLTPRFICERVALIKKWVDWYI